jgi:hypothetical protein
MPRGANMYDEGRVQGRNFASSDSIQIITQGIVTDDLVLHLDAGNYASYPASGTIWRDLSGLRSNGTLVNGPLFDSDKGGCIDLDGTNDYISLPLSLELISLNGQDLTICAWFYLRGAGGILFSTTRSSPSSTLIYGIYPSQQIFNVFPPSGGQAGVGLTSPTDTWSFYAVSAIAGVNATFYQNLNTQTAAHTEIYTGATPTAVTLGAQLLTPQYINGKIAVFSVYNRALSPQEITQNFNATCARFGV